MFDLDGTLADTAPDLCQALNRVLRTLNCSTVALEEVRGWIGNGMQTLLEHALAKNLYRKVDSALIDKGMSLFDLFYSDAVWVESVCYPGVLNGLLELREIGFKLACVTNKPRSFSLEVLKQSGLDAFFHVLVAGNDLPERKPSPVPLLHAIRQLRVNSRECVVIGDSKIDIDAARNAGMMVLLVTWGYHQDLELSEMGANQLIKTFSQIPKSVLYRGLS